MHRKPIKKENHYNDVWVSGFTLIELSISLVIIGLIVGGILGARDLIRQAELHAVTKDVEGFKAAIHTFKLKYSGLPGDIRNASSYWPSCDGTPANCDGDGDGMIDDYSGAGWEGYRGWQQLSDSGIIPGSYTGLPGSGVVFGINVPGSPIESGGYRLLNGTLYSRQHNFILFATSNGGTETALSGPVINTIDAVAIDKKIDDGAAATGEVLGTNGWITGTGFSLGCLDLTPNPDIYDLTNTDVHCTLNFVLN